jgi:trimethylamine--corrinoid protein Co-methyltransferase
MTIGMADDVSEEVADRVIMRQALAYCEKPIVFCCKDLNSTRDIYEMAVLIAGGEQQFYQAPTIVQNLEPISPLLHYDVAIEKLMFCAEKGIPLLYFPAPQAGSTAPATFAATIVQGSAESLSGLVLAQLVRPGTPFIYGAFTTVMDMRTTIFSYGAPEMSLMVAALAQMAQYYQLPFWGTAGCSDAKFPDPQASAEAAFSCIISALSGANMIHDPGWIDHGSVTSPAHMVLVDEVLHMVNHFMQGILVNEETLALDIIDRIGPSGHFLHEKHTMKHFRQVWYPQIFDRTFYDTWLEQGSNDFEERLQEKTKKMMEHTPNALPLEIQKELDRMVKHWK